MSQLPPNADKSQVLRTMQIIVFALVAGVVAFGVVAVSQAWGQPPGDPFLEALAAAFAFAALVARIVVPPIMVRVGRQQIKASSGRNDTGASDDDHWTSETERQLYGVYQMKLIVGTAILEGAAFFSLYAYMMGRHWWSLCVSAALLAAMLAGFPTQGRVEAWVEEQRRSLELET